MNENQIKLTPINIHNWHKAADLSVSTQQTSFIPSNHESILVAQFFPLSKQAVLELENGEPVGYALYGVEGGSQRRKVFRLMVDQNFQHQGFGKAAMRLILNEFFSDHTCSEVILCYSPSNSITKQFYSAIGFVEVGLLECPKSPEGKIEAKITRASFERWTRQGRTLNSTFPLSTTSAGPNNEA